MDDAFDLRSEIDVKALRETLGWTQERLAETLGVDRSIVSRMERGHEPRRPVKMLLRKLSADFQAGLITPDSSPAPTLEATGTAA